MTKTCLNCEVSENDKTLLVLTYKEETLFICPQCLPLLIHKPEKLSEKLPGAETFGDAAHHH
jgi:hypothetical protein